MSNATVNSKGSFLVQPTMFDLSEITHMVDVSWVLLCTALVFFMQGGFILV